MSHSHVRPLPNLALSEQSITVRQGRRACHPLPSCCMRVHERDWECMGKTFCVRAGLKKRRAKPSTVRSSVVRKHNMPEILTLNNPPLRHCPVLGVGGPESRNTAAEL